MNQFSCCDGNTTPEGGNTMQSPANGRRVILNSDMTVLLHIAWWSSYQNVKCSIDLPSIMQEFLEVSQFYSLLGAVTLQDLSISGVKSQTKLPVFQSEIRVNPRLHCTSFPCFASPHFLLPRLLDHLRFASKCKVKSLDI